jgi:hypothetical protein
MAMSAADLKGFSREAFERSDSPDRMCRELERILLPRLEAASDRPAEAYAIIDDLCCAGHVLWSWDESDNFSTWGDSYANPLHPTRFLIDMEWPSEDEPSLAVEVTVTFGPWPGDETRHE